jgi:hypothetical protein
LKIRLLHNALSVVNVWKVMQRSGRSSTQSMTLARAAAAAAAAAGCARMSCHARRSHRVAADIACIPASKHDSSRRFPSCSPSTKDRPLYLPKCSKLALHKVPPPQPPIHPLLHHFAAQRAHTPRLFFSAHYLAALLKKLVDAIKVRLSKQLPSLHPCVTPLPPPLHHAQQPSTQNLFGRHIRAGSRQRRQLRRVRCRPNRKPDPRSAAPSRLSCRQRLQLAGYGHKPRERNQLN